MATQRILSRSNILKLLHIGPVSCSPSWFIRKFLKNFDKLDRYQKTGWHDKGCTSLVYLSGAEQQCDCWLSEARRLLILRSKE